MQQQHQEQAQQENESTSTNPLQYGETIDWDKILQNKTPYSPLIENACGNSEHHQQQHIQSCQVQEIVHNHTTSLHNSTTLHVQHNYQHATQVLQQHYVNANNNNDINTSNFTSSSSTPEQHDRVPSKSNNENKCSVLVRYRRKSEWDDMNNMKQWYSEPHKYVWHITVQPHIVQTPNIELSFELIRCVDNVIMDPQFLHTQLQSKWVEHDGSMVFEYICHFTTNSHANRNSTFKVRVYYNEMQIFESQAKIIYARKRNREDKSTISSAGEDKQAISAPEGKKPKKLQ